MLHLPKQRIPELRDCILAANLQALPAMDWISPGRLWCIEVLHPRKERIRVLRDCI